MMQLIRLLWDFGRPHTIIGSLLSISTLYVLASSTVGIAAGLSIYGWTLAAALACNVCITGLNQVVDVDLDRTNKPFLPIAAGRLSIETARLIVVVALVISLVTAWKVDVQYFGLIIVITAIGYLYSAPPIRLKRHHLPASMCIVVVRGILVNLGIGLILERLINGEVRTDHVLVPLAVFMSAFSLAIAWYKDLYDVAGDEAHKVKTLAVLYSVKFAYYVGGAIVIGAYLYAIYYAVYTLESHWLMIGGHVALLSGFVVHIASADINSRAGIYRFYMIFWVFFFAEYLLYLTYGLMAG